MAMFNREETLTNTAETIIGSSVKVEGNFIGSGNVVVEGVVNGTLKTAQELRVGEAAKIKADVEAANAVIAGEIHGNVKITGRLELLATGKIFGNIDATVIVVNEGAILNGKVTMVKAGDQSVPTSVIDKKRNT